MKKLYFIGIWLPLIIIGLCNVVDAKRQKLTTGDADADQALIHTVTDAKEYLEAGTKTLELLAKISTIAVNVALCG